VRRKFLGWPAYLAILIGVTAAVDFAFQIFGLGKTTLGGIFFFVAAMVLWDVLLGETPAQERREEER
jgi:hypothetical protein